MSKKNDATAGPEPSCELEVSQHPFLRAPHKTLLSLSVPVLFSLVAEPITGLVDTAFIATFGAVSLAALGVGTMVLSGFFWIFNFLAVGTQTEVAQALGRRDREGAGKVSSVAFSIGLFLGLPVALLGWMVSSETAELMAASGAVQTYAVEYIRIRWLGAPAVLITLATFGTLRGLEDMKTPLKVALFVNGLNILLDGVLIFGLGPFPELGISGAAIATVVSQWLGAVWAVRVVARRLELQVRVRAREAWPLLRVGRDLLIRTSALTLFLVLATRSATAVGTDSGAAHQAIRQVWFFTALFLDSFAVAGQSLVAFFVGSQLQSAARQVAWYVCIWSVAVGTILGGLMVLGMPLAASLLVPDSALAVFGTAWLISAASQPVNALSFATDGVHWGTGDFRFLRNVVVLATAVGATALWAVDKNTGNPLAWIWVATALWICIRAAFGVARIWPAIGTAPLKPAQGEARTSL